MFVPAHTASSAFTTPTSKYRDNLANATVEYSADDIQPHATQVDASDVFVRVGRTWQHAHCPLSRVSQANKLQHKQPLYVNIGPIIPAHLHFPAHTPA
ncbi:hypothetical protein MKZ38_002316 [Zalerion maritima]|uniref:Uncharacterized protein n=1 Tax=Zalerion maritima TaxID=339359 RepID=A0AAD5RP22_9PEZI|nr:hypothetical protein MKZ38_002316 [Zalerion maritima]